MTATASPWERDANWWTWSRSSTSHSASRIRRPCSAPLAESRWSPVLLAELLNNKGDLVLENIMPMTRAQVARSIVEEIGRGGATEHGGLLLDLRPNLASPQGEFFVKTLKKAGAPILSVVRRAYGRKAADLEEPWDVLPSAHYNMGGIKTDEWCRSSIPTLYACGQAQGGVMGGNRLGSTSLTEIFVFGKRAGRTAAREASEPGVRGGEAGTRAARENSRPCAAHGERIARSISNAPSSV